MNINLCLVIFIYGAFRLKQMDNDRQKIDQDLHEMGKSFARTADDEDMNEKLKVL